MTKDAEERKDISADDQGQAVNKEVGQSDAPVGEKKLPPMSKSLFSNLRRKTDNDVPDDDNVVVPVEEGEILQEDDDSGTEDLDIDLDAIIDDEDGTYDEVPNELEEGNEDTFDDTEIVLEKTTGVTPPSPEMRNGLKDEIKDILVEWPYTVISLASLLGVIVLAMMYLVFVASIVGGNTLPTKDMATVAYVDKQIAGVNDLIATATAETGALNERVIENKNAISLLEELIKTEVGDIRAELAELITADSTLTGKVESLRKSIQKSVYRDIERSILQNHFNVNTAERPLSLYIGSFGSGSASDTKEIAKQINTVRLLLEKGTKIQKITFSTRVVKIIGMYDSDPIKKSHWDSNQELAMARAKLVAGGIGYNGKEITISNDPEFLGLPKNQMRGVYVYVERKQKI